MELCCLVLFCWQGLKCTLLSVILSQPSESLTILQMEKDLRSQVDSLSTQKQKRLQQLRQRLDADEKLCATLGTTAFLIPSSSVVPTEQQLADFDKHIRELEDEKVRMQSFLCSHSAKFNSE